MNRVLVVLIRLKTKETSNGSPSASGPQKAARAKNSRGYSGRSVVLATGCRRPGYYGLPQGRERLYRSYDEAYRGIAKGPLRRDARSHQGRRLQRAGKRRRLLLLHSL